MHTCTFLLKMVHCGTWDNGIVGFMRWVHWLVPLCHLGVSPDIRWPYILDRNWLRQLNTDCCSFSNIESWWRNQMETFSALLALSEVPSQRPVTRSFVIFFDLRLNKQLSKQSKRRWFGTPWRSLWSHCNDECGNRHCNVIPTVAFPLVGCSLFMVGWCSCNLGDINTT